jgi:hypothetical protein
MTMESWEESCNTIGCTCFQYAFNWMINVTSMPDSITTEESQTVDGAFETLLDRINRIPLNPNFEVKFVKRQANSVAHKLAKATNLWVSPCVFYSISLVLRANWLTKWFKFVFVKNTQILNDILNKIILSWGNL